MKADDYCNLLETFRMHVNDEDFELVCLISATYEKWINNLRQSPNPHGIDILNISMKKHVRIMKSLNKFMNYSKATVEELIKFVEGFIELISTVFNKNDEAHKKL